MIQREDKVTVEETDIRADLVNKVNSPDWIIVHCMLWRPGVNLWCTRLEYEHFTPDTPANQLFTMHVGEIEEMLIGTITFPAASLEACNAIAEQCGIRLVHGNITVFGPTGENSMPIVGNNVYSIENVSGHWVYNNDRKEYEEKLEAEALQAEEIASRHFAKYEAENGKADAP